MLPGGVPGTPNLEASPVVQRFVDYAAQNGLWLAAICAAPSILGHKGLLDGLEATANPGFQDQLGAARLSGDYVCVDGRFVTARGMGVAVISSTSHAAPFAIRASRWSTPKRCSSSIITSPQLWHTTSSTSSACVPKHTEIEPEAKPSRIASRSEAGVEPVASPRSRPIFREGVPSLAHIGRRAPRWGPS